MRLIVESARTKAPTTTLSARLTRTRRMTATGFRAPRNPRSMYWPYDSRLQQHHDQSPYAPSRGYDPGHLADRRLLAATISVFAVNPCSHIIRTTCLISVLSATH